MFLYNVSERHLYCKFESERLSNYHITFNISKSDDKVCVELKVELATS